MQGNFSLAPMLQYLQEDTSKYTDDKITSMIEQAELTIETYATSRDGKPADKIEILQETMLLSLKWCEVPLTEAIYMTDAARTDASQPEPGSAAYVRLILHHQLVTALLRLVAILLDALESFPSDAISSLSSVVFPPLLLTIALFYQDDALGLTPWISQEVQAASILVFERAVQLNDVLLRGKQSSEGGVRSSSVAMNDPHPSPTTSSSSSSFSLPPSAATNIHASSRPQPYRSACVASDREQELISSHFRGCLSGVKDVLFAQKVPDLDSDIVMKNSPSLLSRIVATHKFTRLVRFLQHPHLSHLVTETMLIITLLQVLDDPSPLVAFRGYRTLHHISLHAIPSSLRPHRHLLLTRCADTALRGCDNASWPAVCPACVSTIAALEGREPRSYGYDVLLDTLLSDMERRGLDAPRRTVLLACLGPLIALRGLHMARHTSRLLPLLVEWLYMTHDARTVRLSLDALIAIVRFAWPRMRVHLAILWRHANAAYAKSIRDLQPSSAQVAEAEAQAMQDAAHPHPPHSPSSYLESEAHQALMRFETLGRLLEALGGSELVRCGTAGGELERRLAMLDIGVGEAQRDRPRPSVADEVFS